jgi:hypothetical protein
MKAYTYLFHVCLGGCVGRVLQDLSAKIKCREDILNLEKEFSADHHDTVIIVSYVFVGVNKNAENSR